MHQGKQEKNVQKGRKLYDCKKKKHTSLSLQGRSGGQGWGEIDQIDQIDQIPSGHPSP